MKTWNKVSFVCSLIFVAIIFAIAFPLKASLGIIMLIIVIYAIFIIQAILAGNIFRKMVKEKDEEMTAATKRYEELLNKSESTREIFSLLISTQLRPEAACEKIIKLFNLFEDSNWWHDFGENILLKLFFERQSDENASFSYIEHFLKEATSIYRNNSDKVYFLIKKTFSVLKEEELARVIADIYYFHAVNLINGVAEDSAANITFALKDNKKITSELLSNVLDLAKKIITEHYTGNEAQKLLGIIEGEITKASN